MTQFKEFFESNGISAALSYYKQTYKQMIETNPELILKLNGK